MKTFKKTIEIEVSFLGNEIEKRRKTLGFTTEKLAKEIGCTRTTLSNVEAGRNSLGYDKLEKLCEVFRCKASDLLGF